MAYATEHLSVDWIFRIEGTDEIAMTGCSISNPLGYDAEAALLDYDPITHGNTLYAAMITLLEITSINWADYSLLTDVRVAAHSTTGSQLGDPQVFSPASPTDGDNATVLPQATVVLSLRTPATLGQANYGRMYLPHTYGAMTTNTPFMSTTITNAIATAGAAFVDEVNGVFQSITPNGLVSNLSFVGSGTTKEVTRVAVGSVNDTQRRRRNQLPEVYSYVPVT